MNKDKNEEIDPKINWYLEILKDSVKHYDKAVGQVEYKYRDVKDAAFKARDDIKALENDKDESDKKFLEDFREIDKETKKFKDEVKSKFALKKDMEELASNVSYLEFLLDRVLRRLEPPTENCFGDELSEEDREETYGKSYPFKK